MAHPQVVELEYILAEYAEMYGLTKSAEAYFRKRDVAEANESGQVYPNVVPIRPPLSKY